MQRAYVRPDPIPLPWISFPRDVTSLSGIIVTLEAMAPLHDFLDEAEQKFWDTLRAHCVGIARRANRSAGTPFL